MYTLYAAVQVTTFHPFWIFLTRYIRTRRINLDILRRIPVYFVDQNTYYSLDPSFEHTNKEVPPLADNNNVKIFNELQKLAGIGLVVRCEEEHMYFAAMNSKSCKLTAIGKYYWQLVKNDII